LLGPGGGGLLLNRACALGAPARHPPGLAARTAYPLVIACSPVENDREQAAAARPPAQDATLSIEAALAAKCYGPEIRHGWVPGAPNRGADMSIRRLGVGSRAGGSIDPTRRTSLIAGSPST